jgi:hypothetical protein
MTIHMPRKDDETLLHWLKLRAAGVSTVVIAAHYGVTDSRVRTTTNRVHADDAKAHAVQQ